MRRLGVAMVGGSFMGRTHSHAWRTAPHVFDLPAAVDMVVLAGRDAGRADAAARQLGWRGSTDDWRSVLERDDVDLVDVCVPGDLHEEVAVAALAAGKHVLCEKPLASTLDAAERMADAARAAADRGVLSMVGFSYRRVPALALAQRLVADGRVGDVRQVVVSYAQDWLVDPDFPLTWRLQSDRAGSGALGDIGSHAIDMVQHLTGHRFTDVVAAAETFTRERPVMTSSEGLSATGGSERGPVTVDDTTAWLGRTDRGALVVAHATRVAPGRKNAFRLEVDGSTGSIAFDLERLDELQLHDATAPAEEAGVRTVHVTEPGHPYLEGWWPPGHSLGYGDTFTHQAKDLVEAVVAGEQPRPSFDDGLQVQRVMDAVAASAREGRWEHVAA
ncbi:Gfo/Idh/MocA family oxidoreductase [Pseudokineococcus basanitobsidens]|uniref:Gfo/Idh/MocA family oxidoreductase n=2 Tax=Pseudokineococcus basanitobsidens TaxID=1926649 RepID=A0ABU8RKI2_9ACTN